MGLIMKLMNILRDDGKDIPWRMNVFINPPPPMVGGALDPPSSMPTLTVHGKRDPWFIGKPYFPESFTNILQLDHVDGHEFPMTAPFSQDVYRKVADEMR